MCDDKYGSPLKPPISTFELNTDGLSLNEQIKLHTHTVCVPYL